MFPDAAVVGCLYRYPTRTYQILELSFEIIDVASIIPIVLLIYKLDTIYLLQDGQAFGGSYSCD